MKKILRPLFYKFFPIHLFFLWLRVRNTDSAQNIPTINANTFFKLLARGKRTFVQIGANDGVKNDPIYHHVKKSKWQGVLVEPLPDFIKRLKENYKGCEGLQFENSGISDVNGTLDFYFLPSEWSEPDWFQQIGSFSKESILFNLSNFPEIIPRIVSKKIPVLTLKDLFLKYDIHALDLLLIDAEGFEMRILQGLTASEVRPTYIFYEWGSMAANDNNKLKVFFANLGYKLYVAGPDILAVR